MCPPISNSIFWSEVMSLRLERYRSWPNFFSEAPEITISPASEGGKSDEEESAADFKSSDLNKHINNILKILPAEVIATYPTFQLAFGRIENYGPSIAGAMTLLATVVLRIMLDRETKNGAQASAVVMSAIVCVLWVYSSGGFIFYKLPVGWESAPSGFLAFFSLFTPFLVRK